MTFGLVMKILISVTLLSTVAALAIANKRLYRALMYVAVSAYVGMVLAVVWWM